MTASSQMMTRAWLSSRASLVPGLTKQEEVLMQLRDILNMECAVAPSSSNKAAMPEEATTMALWHIDPLI